MDSLGSKEATSPQYARGDIVTTNRVIRDENGYNRAAGTEVKVLAVNGRRMQICFYYWRSCPYDRYKANCTVDDVRK